MLGFLKFALLVLMAVVGSICCIPSDASAGGPVVVQRRGIIFPRVTRTRVVGGPAAIVAPRAAFIAPNAAFLAPQAFIAPQAFVAPHSQQIIVPSAPLRQTIIVPLQ
jgi:hypothetical protein